MQELEEGDYVGTRWMRGTVEGTATEIKEDTGKVQYHTTKGKTVRACAYVRTD